MLNVKRQWINKKIFAWVTSCYCQSHVKPIWTDLEISLTNSNPFNNVETHLGILLTWSSHFAWNFETNSFAWFSLLSAHMSSLVSGLLYPFTMRLKIQLEYVDIFVISQFRLCSHVASTFWKQWKMSGIGLQFTWRRHIFPGRFWKR